MVSALFAACVHAPPAPATPPAPVVFSEVAPVALTDVDGVLVVGGTTFVFAAGDLVALTPEGAVAWRVPAEDATQVRFSTDGAWVVVSSFLGCISRVEVATGEVVTHPMTVNPAGWDVDAAGAVAWSTGWMVPKLVGRRFDGAPDIEVPISRDELEGDVWVDGELDLALVLGSDDLVARALPSGDELARIRAGNRQLCRFSGGVVGWRDGDQQGALDGRTLAPVEVEAPCGPPPLATVDDDGTTFLPLADGAAWAWEDGWLVRVGPTTRSITSSPRGDRWLDTEPSSWSSDGLQFERPVGGTVLLPTEQYNDYGFASGDHAVVEADGWLRAVDLRTSAVVDRLRVEGGGVVEATWTPEVGWTMWINDEIWTVGPQP